jgi:hypothetical protein
VRADSLKLKESASSLRITGSSSSSSSSSSNSNGCGNVHVSDEKPNEISEDLEPGEYTDGVWRIVMSDKLGRPFFYNTTTKVGQFVIPEELTEAGLKAEGLSAAGAERGDLDANNNPSAAISEIMDLCASDSSEVEVAGLSSRTRLRRESKRQKSSNFSKSHSQKELDNHQIEEGKDRGEDYTSGGENGLHRDTSSDAVRLLCEKGGEPQGNTVPETGSALKNHTDNIFREWNADDSDDDDVVAIVSKQDSRRLSEDTGSSGIKSCIDEACVDVASAVEEKDSSWDSGIGVGQRQAWSEPSKWNCSRCTYENEPNDPSCTMCAQPNSSLQPRRSQRDRDRDTLGGQGQQSGSIMRGFALALSQQQPSVENSFGTLSRAGTRLSSSAAAAPHRDSSATKSQSMSSRRR